MPKDPPGTPPGPPQPTPIAPRCEHTTKRGVRCIAIARNGSACWNHSAEGRARQKEIGAKGGRSGALRQGDPGTELGTVDGVRRRLAKLLVALEHDGGLEEESRAKRQTPQNASAQLQVLRVLLTAVKPVVGSASSSAPANPAPAEGSLEALLS